MEDNKPVLTPEIVRKLCRGLGGTKDLAGELEEACARVLNGQSYSDVLGDMWGEEEGASNDSLICRTLGPTCQGCPDCSAVMGDATYNEMFGDKENGKG